MNVTVSEEIDHARTPQSGNNSRTDPMFREDAIFREDAHRRCNVQARCSGEMQCSGKMFRGDAIFMQDVQGRFHGTDESNWQFELFKVFV